METLTPDQGLGKGCPRPPGFDGLHLQNEIHTGHAYLKVIPPLLSLLLVGVDSFAGEHFTFSGIMKQPLEGLYLGSLLSL